MRPSPTHPHCVRQLSAHAGARLPMQGWVQPRVGRLICATQTLMHSGPSAGGVDGRASAQKTCALQSPTSSARLCTPPLHTPCTSLPGQVPFNQVSRCIPASCRPRLPTLPPSDASCRALSSSMIPPYPANAFFHATDTHKQYKMNKYLKYRQPHAPCYPGSLWCCFLCCLTA